MMAAHGVLLGALLAFLFLYAVPCAAAFAPPIARGISSSSVRQRATSLPERSGLTQMDSASWAKISESGNIFSQPSTLFFWIETQTSSGCGTHGVQGDNEERGEQGWQGTKHSGPGDEAGRGGRGGKLTAEGASR